MKKTFLDLYKEFFKKLDNYKECPAIEFRPAIRPYIDFIKNSDRTNIYIQNGIVLYFDDGSIMIYVGEDE